MSIYIHLNQSLVCCARLTDVLYVLEKTLISILDSWVGPSPVWCHYLGNTLFYLLKLGSDIGQCNTNICRTSQYIFEKSGTLAIFEPLAFFMCSWNLILYTQCAWFSVYRFCSLAPSKRLSGLHSTTYIMVHV